MATYSLRCRDWRPNPILQGDCRRASEEKCTVQTGTLFGLLRDIEERTTNLGELIEGLLGTNPRTPRIYRFGP